MKEEKWDLGYCSINCNKCKVLEKGDCAGCKGSADKQWSCDCEMRSCAKEKGHNYCFECGEFPCKHIKAFDSDPYEHHSVAVRNMEKMKEIGLDKWLKEQPKIMYIPGWKF